MTWWLGLPASAKLFDVECLRFTDGFGLLGFQESGTKDSDTEEFVPSTWRAEATPTRPAIRTPERSASPKKNVSFSRPKKNEVYQYPSEVVEEPPKPSRKQWRTLNQQQQQTALAEFTDWEYSVDDERADAKDAEDVVETKLPIVRPSNPLTNNLLYRLSGIDTEEDEDNDDVNDISDASEAARLANEEYFDGEWPSQFSLSEFQPNQFFTNWDEKSNDSSAVNGVEDTDSSLQR